MAIDWSSIGTVSGVDNLAVATAIANLTTVGAAGPGQAQISEAIHILREHGFDHDADHLEANRFKYNASTLLASAGFAVLAPLEANPILDEDQYGW